MSDPIKVPALGSEKDRNFSYPIENQGVFVILKVTEPQYKYKLSGSTVECEKRFNFPEKTVKESLNELYREEVDKLETTFNPNKSKYWYEHKLFFRDCKGKDDAFGGFLEKLFDKIKEWTVKPGFLMFFLLAPSLEKGHFLLDKGSGGPECKKCKPSHKFKGGGCYGRRVSDLVREVQQAGQGFAGIPKIFIIQTFSGKTKPTTTAYPKGDSTELEELVDEQIPRGSDTFVLYAHTEQTLEWIRENKFYLIRELCKVIEERKEPFDYAALQNLLGGEDDSAPATVETVNQSIEGLGVKLKLHENDLSNGWWDNICTTVAANVAEFLKEKGREETETYDHMRVYMSSTLRWRLSIEDLLKDHQPQTGA